MVLTIVLAALDLKEILGKAALGRRLWMRGLGLEKWNIRRRR